MSLNYWNELLLEICPNNKNNRETVIFTYYKKALCSGNDDIIFLLLKDDECLNGKKYERLPVNDPIKLDSESEANTEAIGGH